MLCIVRHHSRRSYYCYWICATQHFCLFFSFFISIPNTEKKAFFVWKFSQIKFLALVLLLVVEYKKNGGRISFFFAGLLPLDVEMKEILTIFFCMWKVQANINDDFICWLNVNISSSISALTQLKALIFRWKRIKFMEVFYLTIDIVCMVIFLALLSSFIQIHTFLGI